MSVTRPRRFLLALLALFVFIVAILYLTPRQSISDLFTTTTRQSKFPDEIFGLLHFVTSPDEAGRLIRAPGDPPIPNGATEDKLGVVAPSKPVDMAWYALGSIAKAGAGMHAERESTSSRAWEQRLRTLREDYPLVVFSKTYCPYSRRAKKLLETYDLSPAPKIIEVDLRADSAHIKTLLTRLTQRSTFPNAILHGRSLGGSDDLTRLHEEDRLRELLETAGVQVGWTGDDEGVVL